MYVFFVAGRNENKASITQTDKKNEQEFLLVFSDYFSQNTNCPSCSST